MMPPPWARSSDVPCAVARRDPVLPCASARSNRRLLFSGLSLDCLTFRQAEQAVVDAVGRAAPCAIYFVGINNARMAWADPGYRACLERGSLVFNDGIGVALAGRALGLAFADNLVGTDLLPAVFARLAPRGIRLFLIGGRPSVAERAGAQLRAAHQGLEVVGCAPGYFEAGVDRDICSRIARAKPDILLVGRGSPLQELWIDRNLGRFGPCVAVGVGGFLDYHAGLIARAPRWVRRSRLEWACILLRQPHKCRRYLVDNPLFLLRVLVLRTRMAA